MNAGRGTEAEDTRHHPAAVSPHFSVMHVDSTAACTVLYCTVLY